MTKDEIIAQIQEAIIWIIEGLGPMIGPDKDYSSLITSILFTGDQEENQAAIEEIQEALESHDLKMLIQFVDIRRDPGKAYIHFPNATKADLESLSTDTFCFIHHAPGLELK